MQETFLDSLKSLNINVEIDGVGLLAKVECRLCPQGKVITCRTESTGRWKVTNFITHITNKHKLVFPPLSDTAAIAGQKRNATVDSNEGEPQHKIHKLIGMEIGFADNEDVLQTDLEADPLYSPSDYEIDVLSCTGMLTDGEEFSGSQGGSPLRSKELESPTDSSNC